MKTTFFRADGGGVCVPRGGCSGKSHRHFRLEIGGDRSDPGGVRQRGLGSWNGAPLSPENQPTPEEDELSATLSFYVDRDHKNDLYVVVSNVFDTDFGFITGTAFEYVALTGLTFSLPLSGLWQTGTAPPSNYIR